MPKLIPCEHSGTERACAACIRERHKQRCKEYWLRNTEKYKEYQKQWRRANPKRAAEVMRAYKQKHKVYLRTKDKLRRHKKLGFRYPEGWSLSNMLERQAGACDICRQAFTKTPHVDHDHVSGWVRGLLCPACNHLLGKARDDTRILARAIHYLNTALEREPANDNQVNASECATG